MNDDAGQPSPEHREDHIVFVVDDDPGICKAISELLASVGLRVIALKSAAAYIAYPKPRCPTCLILDLQLPDMNGLELQRQNSEGESPQIVFLTGCGDVPSSVRAMKAGAVDFLVKPFKQADLLRAIGVALARDRTARSDRAERVDLQQRLSTLTSREREVLPLVASGFLNKQAAGELGISEVTLQIHRGKIMKKMRAGSLAELVRMAAKLEIPVSVRRP